jgi:hypothetical protein
LLICGLFFFRAIFRSEVQVLRLIVFFLRSQSRLSGFVSLNSLALSPFRRSIDSKAGRQSQQRIVRYQIGSVVSAVSTPSWSCADTVQGSYDPLQRSQKKERPLAPGSHASRDLSIDRAPHYLGSRDRLCGWIVVRSDRRNSKKNLRYLWVPNHRPSLWLSESLGCPA